MVKLLPCDHEVMGSSPGNSLLQKCRERLHTSGASKSYVHRAAILEFLILCIDVFVVAVVLIYIVIIVSP
jgi:hypothetical protein